MQGIAVLGGTLEVEWGEGFTPTLGSSYSLFGDPQTIAGTFEEIILPEINSDLRWSLVDEVEFYKRRLSLTVVSAGDFDSDGDVDGRDFLLWQRGNSPNPLSAGDLADWQGNYGAGPLTAASVAVPEPSACALLIGVAFLGLLRR